MAGAPQIEIGTLMKPCTKCRNEYPATAEHFYRKHTAYDGLMPHCKICFRAWRKTHEKYDREYEAKKRARVRLFRPLIAVVKRLVSDLEAAKKADNAYRMAKDILSQIKEAKL